MLKYIHLRRVLIFLAILFALSACRTTPVYVSGQIHSGYHHYYYYPDVEVYYDTGRRSYFYFSDGIWRTSIILPQALRLHLGSHVALKLDTPVPYRHHQTHRKVYPRGYFKKRSPLYPQRPVIHRSKKTHDKRETHDRYDAGSRLGSERGQHKVENKAHSKEKNKGQEQGQSKGKSKNQTKGKSKAKDKRNSPDSKKHKERSNDRDYKKERSKDDQDRGERRHNYK